MAATYFLVSVLPSPGSYLEELILTEKGKADEENRAVVHDKQKSLQLTVTNPASLNNSSVTGGTQNLLAVNLVVAPMNEKSNGLHRIVFTAL